MEKTEKKADEKTRNILVVYYSRTGVTKKVAEYMAKELGAETEEIIDRKKRSGACGFVTGGRDALKRRETEIGEIEKDPSQYDLIIIGSPVWAGKLTPAVRTYLNRYKADIKSLAFFFTAGGPNQEKIFKEAKGLLGVDKEPLSLLGLCGEERSTDNLLFKAKLASFTAGIGDLGKAEKKDE